MINRHRHRLTHVRIQRGTHYICGIQSQLPSIPVLLTDPSYHREKPLTRPVWRRDFRPAPPGIPARGAGRGATAYRGTLPKCLPPGPHQRANVAHLGSYRAGEWTFSRNRPADVDTSAGIGRRPPACRSHLTRCEPDRFAQVQSMPCFQVEAIMARLPFGDSPAGLPISESYASFFWVEAPSPARPERFAESQRLTKRRSRPQWNCPRLVSHALARNWHMIGA